MVRINIALRLSKEVEHEAIAIASSLGKNTDTYFFLDGITVLPHVTLYAPVIVEEKIPEVLDIVEKEVATFSEVYLTLKEITESQGFVNLEFGLIPDVKLMQEKLVSAVASLREVQVEETFEEGRDYRMDLSLGSLQSLEKYGSVGIVNFHPHLTLLRMKSELDGQLIKRKARWSLPRFLVSKVGVFVMGEHGTCRELIAEFSLKDI